MNYKQALHAKVGWEKHAKPAIKSMLDDIKRGIIVNTEELKSHQDDLKLLKEAEVKTTDESVRKDICNKINRSEWIIQHAMLGIKRDKQLACFLSYSYNGDLANAVKYFHKFKETSYEWIEDDDKITTTFSLVFNTKEHVREDAYNQMCKHCKDDINMAEGVMKELSFIMSDVKDVLKAGKRMNKRKGKKHRD